MDMFDIYVSTTLCFQSYRYIPNDNNNIVKCEVR